MELLLQVFYSVETSIERVQNTSRRAAASHARSVDLESCYCAAWRYHLTKNCKFLTAFMCCFPLLHIKLFLKC